MNKTLMKKSKEIKIIESKLLNEQYILEFDSNGSELESPLDDDFDDLYQYSFFQKRIYRSSRNIIILESIDLYPNTIYNLDELIKDYFLNDDLAKTINNNLYETINYLNKNENCILKIYWLFSDPICFCLIDDKELFNRIITNDNEYIIHSINKYIKDAIYKNDQPKQFEEAQVLDGIYRKYKNNDIENGGNNE